MMLVIDQSLRQISTSPRWRVNPPPMRSTGHPWTKLADISLPDNTGPISITDSNSTVNTRFYRIVAAAQP
jgi:hypothetical protein